METIVIFTHHDFTMFIAFLSNANFLVSFVYQESLVSELSCLLFHRQVTCQSSTSSTVNVKMARLTNDQKEACNAILEGRNLILTGQAGTGKTFVLPYPTITHHISALIHLLHPTSSIEVNKNNAEAIDQLRPTRPSQVKHPRSDELGQGKHPYRIMLKILISSLSD